MGDNQGNPEEYPERQVNLRPFKIDRTEVTNAAYRMCVQAKACDASRFMDDPILGKEDHPVVGVTWEDAVAFCEWVGRRLPTEAEWEMAAKGKDHRKWPWQGAFRTTHANTNQADDHELTAPVNAYDLGRSTYGALNMAGNAGEWVQDYFDPTYYRSEDNVTDPTGPTRGRERVVRGGSYLEPSHLARVSARRAKLPTESDNTVGFRCARDD